MKKGITLSVLTITVVIMLILISVSTVVGIRSVKTATYEEYISKLDRVSNDVNQYYIKNKTLPITTEVIAKEGLSNGLKLEISNNKDDYNNLYVVDMNKLRSESVKIGYGTANDMDIFVVCENTNNVYYLKGMEYKGTTYYGVQK